MASRREFLTLAATGLGFGASADLEELYEGLFAEAEVCGIDVEGHCSTYFETPYFGSELDFDGAHFQVIDWYDEIGLSIGFENDDGLQTGWLVELSIKEVRALRDVLTVAIEAHEEWGTEDRPNESDWRRR